MTNIKHNDFANGNAVQELSLEEIDTVNGAGPVADFFDSVSDVAAGVAASTPIKKVRRIATGVSLAADAAADYAESKGW